MVDQKEIKQLLDTHFHINGDAIINPSTGVVDVDGNVDIISVGNLPRFPVQFGIVKGYFDCGAVNLESLEGSPNEVWQGFNCAVNQLISLEGAPNKVMGSFTCDHNKLVDLKGAPTHVGGDFVCTVNPLASLDGFPASVKQVAYLTYSNNLPLLRTLSASKVILHCRYHLELRHVVNHTLNHHAGQGRRGAIQAARELLQAGELLQKEQALDHNPFERNARW
jgi:hypothetical protein